MLAAAVVVSGSIACGRKDNGAETDSLLDESGRRSRGPDPIVLRIPRTGGSVRAYLYPKLDSVVWSGRGISVQRVLAFDPEGGILAIIDGKGNPGRIDLRFGSASTASQTKLTSLTSINGADIYGLDSKGAVKRLTRTGDWTFAPPSPASSIFPQLDGSLVVVSQKEGEATIWKVRPPESKLLDTVEFSLTARGIKAQVGDRVYFATREGLVGIRTRDMSVVTPISLDKRAKILAPTPSGDRMYVTLEGEKGLSVIDRYTDRVSSKISLPGEVAEIRMDPLGRYVLAKPVKGDSAWVIAVATDRVVGSVPTTWTNDLPACAPDGAIAVSNGRDVSFVDGETLQSVRTIVGGAKDYWYFMFWNGFRPRIPGTEEQSVAEVDDTPVEESIIAEEDVAVLVDSPTTAPVPQPQPQQDTPSTPPTPRQPPAPTPPTIVPAEPIRPPVSPQSYTVSFAALLNEEKAIELANSIVVNGVKARVLKTERAGTPIFRVVLGPYATRAMAEQVGKDSKRQFWIYTGEP
jgi:cell division septation protein DedD